MSSDATLDILRDIGKLELALADFYETVASLRPADADFWKMLEGEERQHAAHIAHLSDLFVANRSRFQENRRFNAAAIQSFLVYVQTTMERLRRGEIAPDDDSRILALAQDMEQSIIEGKYGEIVKTADAEYRLLMKQILDDTATHKRKILGRLASRPTR